MTKQETLVLAIGTWVFCTVTAIRQWTQVTAIRPRDGYIKVNLGHNVWCPPHNFSLVNRDGQSWQEVTR